MFWHVRRDSNPQPAVLETAALPIEPLTCEARSLGFLVRDMLVAPRAVLLELDATGMLALVLRGRVVPPFALGAFKSDDVSHGRISLASFFDRGSWRRCPRAVGAGQAGD